MNGWEDGFHNNNHNAILLLLLLRHVICRATILTIRYVRFWAEPSHTKEGMRAAMALESGASFLASKNFGKIPLLNYCRGSVPPPLLLSIDTNQVTA